MNKKNDINDLEKKIQAEKEKHNSPQQPSEDKENMRLGLRAGTEMVAAVAAGGAIGYFLDKSFETKPLFLLVMLILGVITGFVNVWRTTQSMDMTAGMGRQTENTDEQKKD